jgi:hypothetical protein
MTIIDLDRPTGEGLAPAGGRRLRPVVVAGLLVAAGAVTGGAVMYGIDAQRHVLADERKVAVLLIAQPSTEDATSETGDAHSGSTRFSAQVLVANTGPKPISVRGITAHNATLSAASDEPAQLVQPGGTATVDLAVTLTCTPTPGALNTVLPLVTASVSAETLTHVGKNVSPVELDVRPWFRQLETSLGRCLNGE